MRFYHGKYYILSFTVTGTVEVLSSYAVGELFDNFDFENDRVQEFPLLMKK